MPFRETLACGFQKCVGNLWTGDDYSDFNVIVEDTSFRCHRFILSACSVFFQCMFKSPMKEQIEGRARLEAMTASTFEIIINVVYTGVEKLSIDNVLDVWSASEMLQIGYLTKQCHSFVMENISVETCFRFLNHATLYDADTVVDHCLDFISKNVKEIGGEEHLFPLPFDQFYKVIVNQYLAIDHEDLVVAAVLNWVKYIPQTASSTAMDSGGDLEDMYDANDEQSDGDTSTKSLSNSCSQEKIHDDQAIVSCDVTIDELNTRSHILREIANTHSVVPAQFNNISKDVNTYETEVENRKQHLTQLLSACRLFRVKSDFLDNVLKNDTQLVLDTGAYQLLHEALMYTLDVRRRHDAWPDAAVYRASSEFKHVMVFLSNDKLMTYIFNTGHVVELAKLPENCKSVNSTISVFDNVLYLLSNNDNRGDNKLFYMFRGNKTWIQINSISYCHYNSIILLPHGNYMYRCSRNDSRHISSGKELYRFCYAHGHALEWLHCGEIGNGGNCLVRFHKYLLIFYTTNGGVISVECYNTETAKTHKCTSSMSGTSEDMVSFTHSEDVYILQRNGTLWKIFSTDTIPVDFERVCKLWDFDCILKGCVLYRKKLFIFCNSKHPEPTITSLPGVFTCIQIINIDSTTPCLPMTLQHDL